MGDNDPPPEGSRRREAKVAIPRLKRSEGTTSTTKPSVRPQKAVSKACTQCRKRKTRCSGEQPRCQGCIKQDLDCRYDQARRDRLREALQRNHILMELLKDSPVHDDQKKREKVDKVLKAIENDSPPLMPNAARTPVDVVGKRPRKDFSSEDEDDDDDNSIVSEEALVAASAGCYEDLDFLEEGVLKDREVNDTGYLGRESPVHWLQALHERIEQSAVRQRGGSNGSTENAVADSDDNVDTPPLLPRAISESGHFAKFYFYLDSADINVKIGDPNIVPSAEAAGTLYKHYRSVVHDPFRILGDAFVEQLRTFYVVIHGGGTLSVSSRWKACMNLVFAIGARYAQLTDDESQAQDHNHLVYMWRAISLLEFKTFAALASAPDLLLIQATGLLSFYYLTIGHVNRAWYTIGISIRHAQSAGLHLRHKDPSLSVERKTILSQTWWALHSIETILTAITGRPRVISLRDITATPPGALLGTEKRPYNTETGPARPSTRNDGGSTEPSEPPSQPSVIDSKSSFLNGYIGIDLIMHKVLTTLYSPRTNNVSWKQMQKQIAALLAELEEWALQALPHGLLASTALSDMREHFSLYVYYGSAKIYITRPCLCRLDLHSKGQSEGSAEFNKKTAEICVQAALDLCSKFSEQPDPRWLYSTGPWWSSVHIIMQTVAILLLELSRDSTHTTIVRPNVIASLDKLTRWLRHMRVKDAVSERAYNIVCRVRQKIENSLQQESQDPTHHISPTFSSVPIVPTQPLFATTYTPFDTGVSSQLPQPQQPPPHFHINPTAFQHNDFFNQDSHAHGNFHLQPLVQDLVSSQDGTAPFISQEQMSVAFRDSVSTDFNQYTGWDNSGFEDWMAQDRSWQ